MTQENKELLFLDLSARLTYGVKIQVNDKIESIQGINVLDNVVEYDCCLSSDIEEIKPYLFPMSSMTEEQKNEFNTKCLELQLKVIDDEIMYEKATEFEVDFYNKHHLDWRGLIPMGLAIDATDKNIY